MLVDGNPLAVRGLNLEGLRRRGFDSDRFAIIKKMYRLIYRQGLTLLSAREEIEKLLLQQKKIASASVMDVEIMLDFFSRSKRGLAR